jgi:3-oxoacyl-[acyl-carrier protein] reductase
MDNKNTVKKMSGKIALVTGASKGIGASITKHLAGEGVAVVVSCHSGKSETEGVHTAGFLDTDFHKRILEETPVGRIGQPEDIGKVAAFPASDGAGWISGETLLIAGGQR